MEPSQTEVTWLTQPNVIWITRSSTSHCEEFSIYFTDKLVPTKPASLLPGNIIRRSWGRRAQSPLLGPCPHSLQGPSGRGPTHSPAGSSVQYLYKKGARVLTGGIKSALPKFHLGFRVQPLKEWGPFCCLVLFCIQLKFLCHLWQRKSVAFACLPFLLLPPHFSLRNHILIYSLPIWFRKGSLNSWSREGIKHRVVTNGALVFWLPG